ncbi:MAG: Hpt domain-containing protein, partial [Cyanobacteria bacterium P01_D01_bin.56]
DLVAALKQAQPVVEISSQSAASDRAVLESTVETSSQSAASAALDRAVLESTVETSSQSAASAALDRAVLESTLVVLGGLESKAFDDVRSLFIAEASTLVDKILKAIQTQDHEQLELNAHALKSSSGALGGVVLQMLCQSLEDSGRQKEALELSLAEEVSSAFSNFKSALINL